MANQTALTRSIGMIASLHYFLRAVSLTCLSLALATDILYWQTSNLLWLHFSEWLLVVGVAFTGFALLLVLLDLLVRGIRPSWIAVIFGLAVFVLALINNFVHTADGWTAVVPLGLYLSAATVLALIATAWFGAKGAYHA